MHCVQAQLNEEKTMEKYNPSPEQWVCSCPYFLTSHFLVCKHLVQACKKVPARFFQEVTCNCAGPTWQHPKLIPWHPKPSETPSSSSPESNTPLPNDPASPIPNSPLNNCALISRPTRENTDSDSDSDSETSEHGNDSDGLNGGDGMMGYSAFEEELEDCHAVLLGLLDILDYNTPLYDSRILPTLWLKLTGAKDLHRCILEKENQVNSARTANLNTFDPKMASIMFFQARPAKRIQDFKQWHHL